LDFIFFISFRFVLLIGLEGVIAKAVAPPTSPKGAESPSESELKAVAKYKDVIREQDGQIQHLRQRLAALEGDHIAAQVCFLMKSM
jgi:hypothetical protein